MIGIFGGTFNPVHDGHIRLAVEAANKLELSTVKMIPCNVPVHRAPPLVTAKIRYQLLQAAVRDCPELTVDDCELQRAGPSYMVDTLAFQKQNSGDSLCLIIGQDAFVQLDSWFEWRQLFDYAHIAVLRRPHGQVENDKKSQPFQDYIKARIIDDVQQLHTTPNGKIIFLINEQMDNSSSDIRRKLEQGQSVKGQVPDVVLDLILQKGLYNAVHTVKKTN